MLDGELEKKLRVKDAEIERLKHSSVGNMAAMYEALVRVKRLFDGRLMWQPDIRKAHEAVNSALSEPPRNCDIYTTEESVDEACASIRECVGCPSQDHEAPCVFCTVRWLLAPAGKNLKSEAANG
jgi:hypothetical protein